MKTYKYLNIEETQVGVIDEDGLQRVQTVPDRVPEGEPITPYDGPSALDEWRNSAALDKATFLIRVMNAGILSKADAKAAAKGNWPASMSGALAAMTAKEADEAEIVWASAKDVHRNSPIMAYVQAVAGMTDEQVDELFA